MRAWLKTTTAASKRSSTRSASRVDRRTFIQDVSEPLTGRIDRRKIAAKFNNLEDAVDELAVAVERVAEEKSA